jgi:hypothetical protein
MKDLIKKSQIMIKNKRFNKYQNNDNKLNGSNNTYNSSNKMVKKIKD